MLTDEQRARLDELREKRERGEQPAPEPTAPPVHMQHAHGGTGGVEPCACPKDCPWCMR
jgi:hypothetical protein